MVSGARGGRGGSQVKDPTVCYLVFLGGGQGQVSIQLERLAFEKPGFRKWGEKTEEAPPEGGLSALH